MTNIAGLRVSGFRGLTSEVDLDLNANAVIIIGVNGQGKTSLLDAIMWCITGAIPRLVDERSLVSLYSSSGEARVELRLTEPSGEAFEIIRTTDGQSSAISLTDGRGRQRGVEAEAAIVQRLWPYALNAPSPRAALLSAYERSVYLQQDLVRDFVESKEAHERFAALSELLGAGRINELQRSVERSRLSWSRATNQVIEQSNHLRSLVASREAQLASYSEGPSDIVPRQEWDRWWVRAMELVEGIAVDGPVPNPTAGTSSAAVDDASRQLRAWLRSMTSRLEALEDTREAVSAERHRPVEDRAALEDRLEERRRQLADARSQIQTAETALRAIRESQASERLSGAELRTLATLAIRHLGERCPVCTQPYDAEATRRHLEQLINAEAQPSGPEPDIAGMVRAASEEEEAVRALEGELREIDALRRSQERRLARLAQESELLSVSAIPDQAWEDRLADEEHRIQDLVSLGEDLLAEGESLALSLARLGDEARREELVTELTALRGQLAQAESMIEERQRAGSVGSQIIEALRSGVSDVVRHQLNLLSPLLQRIYSSVDPHPAFRDAIMHSAMARGRGALTPTIVDPTSSLSIDEPWLFLASSQLNVLAVSIFLTMSLGIQELPLSSAILDDPLQSLDDVNLLGLTDLLRQARSRRQLVISTHDRRFGDLLQRKLRPVAEGQRTVVVELEGWGRGGPQVTQRDSPVQDEPLRLVG